MSDIIASPFKKPKCGDMWNLGGLSTTTSILKDVIGGLINLLVVGTDPDLVTQPVDGAAMVTDYYPGEIASTVNLDPDGNGYPRVNPDGTFFITIETDAASYAVVLADGTQFTITPAQSTAYLGQWYPARLMKVLADGTTGSFSVGY
jgi:hypothetical protein